MRRDSATAAATLRLRMPVVTRAAAPGGSAGSRRRPGQLVRCQHRRPRRRGMARPGHPRPVGECLLVRCRAQGPQGRFGSACVAGRWRAEGTDGGADDLPQGTCGPNSRAASGKRASRPTLSGASTHDDLALMPLAKAIPAMQGPGRTKPLPKSPSTTSITRRHTCRGCPLGSPGGLVRPRWFCPRWFGGCPRLL